MISHTPSHAAATQPRVLILAAGSGRRLQRMTVAGNGEPVPKQFCSLAGTRTLFEDALARASLLTPRNRVSTIVAAEHHAWWKPLSAGLPQANVIVQPENRGTAIGIALSCVQLCAQEPDATVAMLPSDHYVRNESALVEAITFACAQVRMREDAVVLIGITPEEPDPELGYILATDSLRGGCGRVARFVEKPSREEAARLIAHGALWNSFIVVARAARLLALCAEACPAAVLALRSALRSDAVGPAARRELERIYSTLPTLDFSRDVLSSQATALSVIAASACGWTDLGTPVRVARCLGTLDRTTLASQDTRHVNGARFPNLFHAWTASGCPA